VNLDPTVLSLSYPPGVLWGILDLMDRSSPFGHMLEQAEEELWLAFNKTQTVKHSVLTGSAREAAVRKFLDEQLPARFAVARGEAFDADRRRSGELDLVIYDRMNVKPLQIDKEHSLLPAEGLLAVIEVKSRLTKEEIRRCFDGAQKLGKLRPDGRAFIFSRSGGAPADRNPRCLFTIFAFQSDLASQNWAEREWERLREVASARGVPLESVDRVIVLNRGLIIPPTCTARKVGDRKGLLREWFLHVTNFLVREASRRAPFEWRPYSGGKEEWIRLEGYEPSSQKRTNAKKRTTKRGKRGSGSRRRVERRPKPDIKPDSV
jgi:hypothetical protein